MKVHSSARDFLDANVRKTGGRTKSSNAGFIIEVDGALSELVSQFPERGSKPMFTGKRDDGKPLDQRP
jgi:hypothetical protein